MPSSVIRYSTLIESPREREDLLREITEICGAAGTVGDGEAEADALGDGEAEAEALGDGEAEAEALGEAEADALGLADALGDGEGEATRTDTVPSNTSSLKLLRESVVCVLKEYVPAISGVPEF